MWLPLDIFNIRSAETVVYLIWALEKLRKSDSTNICALEKLHIVALGKTAAGNLHTFIKNDDARCCRGMPRTQGMWMNSMSPTSVVLVERRFSD